MHNFDFGFDSGFKFLFASGHASTGSVQSDLKGFCLSVITSPMLTISGSAEGIFAVDIDVVKSFFPSIGPGTAEGFCLSVITSPKLTISGSAVGVLAVDIDVVKSFVLAVVVLVDVLVEFAASSLDTSLESQAGL